MGRDVTPVCDQRWSLVLDVNVLLDLLLAVRWPLLDDIWPLPVDGVQCSHTQLLLTASLVFHWCSSPLLSYVMSRWCHTPLFVDLLFRHESLKDVNVRQTMCLSNCLTTFQTWQSNKLFRQPLLRATSSLPGQKCVPLMPLVNYIEPTTTCKKHRILGALREAVGCSQESL